MSRPWTPGPWQWVLMGSEGGVVRATGRGVTAREHKSWRDDGHTPDIVNVRYGQFDELQANGRLIAAAPELYDALEFASLWMWDPDEGPVDSYERINDWFMRETGYMRPGKSYPMETPPPDDLQQIWDRWRVQKSREVLAMIRAALAKLEGKES